jgi:DNA-binding GntR family transcriptional regulator
VSIQSALLTAIVDHRLPPGTRLPEDELGVLFGASRTVVRAALQALAREGVVTQERYRGARVARPSVKEAQEIFEARSLIEPQVAALAAKQKTAASTRRLHKHLNEERAAVARGETGQAIALSGAFHVAIAEMANQEVFTGFVRELISRSALIVALFWRRAEVTCEQDAHRNLVNAIARGKPDDAARLMKRHLSDLVAGLDMREHLPGDSPLAELLLPRS